MRLFVSQTNDPFINLAFEESLVREEGDAAFLWVNGPCVVLGRNQDAFREVDVVFLETHGIALARRLSGGGAVYHDAGNLNYSVAFDEPDEDKAAEWALAALESLGVDARLAGRNDLMVGQAKIGGLAAYGAGRCLQHGTLLVNADMLALERALRPSPLKLRKHGIASAAARVANLASLVEGVSVVQVMAAFEEALGVSATPARVDATVLDRACELRDSAWTLGVPVAGDVEFEMLVDGEVYELSLEVGNGIVVSAHISTDACRPPDVDAIAARLVGCGIDRAASIVAGYCQPARS